MQRSKQKLWRALFVEGTLARTIESQSKEFQSSISVGGYTANAGRHNVIVMSGLPL